MRYFVAASALKVFSSTSLTRRLYRYLGRRQPKQLVHEWGEWILQEVLGTNPTSESRALELGTGWIHAYTLYPALLTDSKFFCFDVVDNRSFGALAPVLQELRDRIALLEAIGPREKERALARVERATGARNFDELYEILNIEYVLNEEGNLNFPDNYFDVIYSMDVLEHVSRAGFRTAAENWHRVLKSGAIFVAQVGLDDHLTHFDGSKSDKEYLAYSSRFATRIMDSRLLYINRMTASEILTVLSDVGFQIETVERELVDLGDLKIKSDYAGQSQEDLSSVRLILRARKLQSPEAADAT